MPDANGGRADLAAVPQPGPRPPGRDLPGRGPPHYISQMLRVQPPGRAWGIAGYSEGGFCAANLGLSTAPGSATPACSAGTSSLRTIRWVTRPGGSTRSGRAPGSGARTPRPTWWHRCRQERRSRSSGWGSARRIALTPKNAEVFEQLVQSRQPGGDAEVVPGGGHTMFTWRALMPPLLEWMTPRWPRSAACRAACRPPGARGPAHPARSSGPGTAGTAPARQSRPARPGQSGGAKKQHRRRWRQPGRVSPSSSTAHVQHGPLVQRRPQRPVQAVFQVELAFPAHHMGKQVAVEGGVRGQDGLQIEHVLRGDELIQPDWARRDLCPFARGPGVIGIGPSLSDLLKDHV